MATVTRDLYKLTATEAAKMIAAGDIKPEAYAEACLDRIAARADLKAWAYLDRELALKNARGCGSGENSVVNKPTSIEAAITR